MSIKYLLDPEKFLILADALGDTPETVISGARLRRGLCRAYVLGDMRNIPPHFEAAIIQENFAPEEPVGFGTEAQRLWEVLKTVPGWACINVAATLAPALGALIQAEMGVAVRYYGDVYYSLSQPVQCPDYTISGATIVRRLTCGDLDLIHNAPEDIKAELHGQSMPWLNQLLTEGLVAAAITSDTIVAIAQTYAQSEYYADIGVFTLADWRNQGLATATAAIVAQGIQETGRTPIWSTGEDNHASMNVAEKLGFTEVSRRTYVIPQR
jgi:hypothetical protein